MDKVDRRQRRKERKEKRKARSRAEDISGGDESEGPVDLPIEGWWLRNLKR